MSMIDSCASDRSIRAGSILAVTLLMTFGGSAQLKQSTNAEPRLNSQPTPRAKPVSKPTPLPNPALSNAVARVPKPPARIEITNDTAIAEFAPHKARFAANLNSVGAIDFATPEGKRLRSQLLGLVFHDTFSGRTELLAETQECFGVVEGDNRVVYKNAFTDIKADVIYTYTRQSFSQDILLLQSPRLPESYSMNPLTTRLEIWTEFLTPPDPVVKAQQVPVRLSPKGVVEATAVDEYLDFGTMSIGTGHAFLVGSRAGKAESVVTKRWIRAGGRIFLVESADWASIQPQLSRLPRLAQGSRSSSPGSANSLLASSGVLFPERRPSASTGVMKQIAAAATPTTGFLLDYVISNNIPTSGLKLWVRSDTGVTNSGTTVSGWRDLSGNTNHFKQTNSAKQPLYVEDSINGQPVIRFDGTNSEMDSVLTLARSSLPNATVYTVERIRSVVSGFNAVWSTDGVVGNFKRARGFDGDNFLVQLGFDDENGGHVWNPDVGAATNTVRIVGITFMGYDAYLFLNGSNYSAGIEESGDAAQPLQLGYGSTYQHSRVDFAEMLVYDHQLSDAERLQLENVLNARYNVYSNRLDPPTFSINGGDFTNSVSVELTNSVDDVTIQHSTTGLLWTNYSGPLTLSNTTTLLARCLKFGYGGSDIAIEHYKRSAFTNQAIPMEGLLLRLKADSGVLLDGTNVSQWLDQSGQSNHATQSILAYRPDYVTNAQNGKPAIRFDGTNGQMNTALALPRSTFPNVTVYTVEHIRENPGDDIRLVWSTDGDVGDFQRSRGYGYDGVVVQMGDWGSFGESVWYPGISADTNNFRIVGLTYTTNNTYLYINGTNYAAGKENVGDGSEPLRIAAGYGYGQNSAVDLVELLVYDHELSDADRLQLEAALRKTYLEIDVDGDGLPDEWEIAHFGSISAYGPNDDPDRDGLTNLQEYQNGTDPNAIPAQSALRLWLQANAITNVANGVAVGTWPDSSGFTNNATQSTTNNRPLFITNGFNGRPVVRFDGTNKYFNVSNFLSGVVTQAEAFVVLKVVNDPASSGTGPGLWTFGTSGFASHHPGDNGKIYDDFGSTVQQYEGDPSFSQTNVYAYNVVTRPGEWTARVNGQYLFTTNVNTVAFTATPTLGTSPSFPFVGDIAEVLIYARPLTPEERDSVGRYLNLKYAWIAPPIAPTNLIAKGIATNQIALAWNYPLSNAKVNFFVERKAGTNDWSAVGTVENLTSYIDTNVAAATTYAYRARASSYGGDSDYSSETNATSGDAGDVSVPLASIRLWLQGDTVAGAGLINFWADASGFGNHARQFDSDSRPLHVTNGLNGRPVVRFDGSSDYFKLPNFLDGVVTQAEAFVVLKVLNDPAATGTGPGLWHFGTSGFASHHPGDNGRIYDTFGNTGQRNLGDPSFSLTNAYAYNVLTRTGEWTARINGQLFYSSDTNTVAFNTAPTLGTSPGFPFAGDIAELLIFDRPLTSEERDAVGIYLNTKFAISSEAPAAPTGFLATASDDSGSGVALKLSWNTVSNAVAYQLERTLDTNGAYDVLAYFAPTNAFLDVTLTPGTTYFYRIKAFTYAGKSAYSTTISPPTTTITDPLHTAIFTMGTNVTLNGTASDSDGAVTKVEVFDRAQLIGTFTNTSFTLTLSNITKGTHYFHSKAYDDGSNSMFSALVMILASPDSDGDGISDAQEIMNGTNPYSHDTDGDGVWDNLDPFPLDPTRWAFPSLNTNDHAAPLIYLLEPTNAVFVP